jgi:hypothetical protein
MRNETHLYIGQALWVVAEYCDQLGERNSWLLQIAGEAARVRNWKLARLAVATFRYGRQLGEIEERALDYLVSLIIDEETKGWSYSDDTEYVELREELPL